MKFLATVLLGGSAVHALGAETYPKSILKPSLRNVSYGEHERHVLDVWKAKSDKATPVVMFIHGGGWLKNRKEDKLTQLDPQKLLDAGISVVAINYRLIKHANKEGVLPPVKAPLHDAARALQFVRSKAKEWNFDKKRIGVSGGSAGACSSLWLAYHDDLADPKSVDPVARESTQVFCVGVRGAQTSLDPVQMKEWIPNSRYGGHAFGKKNFTEFLAQRDNLKEWIAEYSPYALVDKSDPPSCLFYKGKPSLGSPAKDPTHSSNFGLKFQERCQQVGVRCELAFFGDDESKYSSLADFFIKEFQRENR